MCFQALYSSFSLSIGSTSCALAVAILKVGALESALFLVSRLAQMREQNGGGFFVVVLRKKSLYISFSEIAMLLYSRWFAHHSCPCDAEGMSQLSSSPWWTSKSWSFHCGLRQVHREIRNGCFHFASFSFDRVIYLLNRKGNTIKVILFSN